MTSLVLTVLPFVVTFVYASLIPSSERGAASLRDSCNHRLCQG